MSVKKALLLVVVAELLIALLAINNYGVTLDGLQATTRFSGRLSLGIFTFLFIFLPFNRNGLAQILSSKPFLIFSIAHGIHLLELLSYVYFSDANLIPVRVAGGFLAYVFIFIMPLLQSYFESGKISLKKFNIAGNIYLYYVWFIFFMSYLPRIQGKLPNVGGSYKEFVVLMVWVCTLLIIRLYLTFSKRKAHA
jgi:hypothetical protein